MADLVYGLFSKTLVDRAVGSGVDFDTDTLKVALVTASYTPNVDTDSVFSDVTNEVSGTGYTAGGATLGSVVVAYDAGNNWTTVDAADTSWTTSTITARAAVLYKSTGTAGTSALIAYYDFGSNKSSTGGTFSIVWNATGLLKFAV